MELLTTDLIRAPKHILAPARPSHLCALHRVDRWIHHSRNTAIVAATAPTGRSQHLHNTPRHTPRHVPPTRHWPVQGLTHDTVPEVPPARPLQLRMQGQGTGPSLQVAPIAYPAAAQSVTEAQAHHRGAQRPRAQEGRRRRHPQEEGRRTGARDWPQAQQE
jgi:hypothetical protein